MNKPHIDAIDSRDSPGVGERETHSRSAISAKQWYQRRSTLVRGGCPLYDRPSPGSRLLSDRDYPLLFQRSVVRLHMSNRPDLPLKRRRHRTKSRGREDLKKLARGPSRNSILEDIFK